jgi:ankyrin repeat protein
MHCFDTDEEDRFQYVACHLETLKQCLTPRMLKHTLLSMPATLDGTYQRMFKAIIPEYMVFARSMLCWLAYANRPLRVAEVIDAMAFLQPDDDDNSSEVQFDTESRLRDLKDIAAICPGLVTVVDDTEANTKQVRLAHNSIKDYIVSSRMPADLASCFKMDPVPSHGMIARNCLAYLLQFESHESLNSEALLEYPLARYAAEFWTQHARIANGESESTWRMAIALLLDNREAFENWIRLWDPDLPEEGPDLTNEGRRIRSPLYYASLLGLTGVITCITDRGLNVDTETGFHGNALQAASYAGFENTVRHLLDLGAQVNFRHPGKPDALQAASYSGHETIVKMLLAESADPNSQGGLFNTALQAAAYRGRTKILDILLQHGARINAVGGRFDSALSAASWSGHLEPVRLLLRRGANVNLQGPQLGTALQAAALDGHGVEELLRVLIEAEADVNIVAGGDLWFGTALQAAAMSGHISRVQILLDAGAEINGRGGRYGSALQAAAADGSVDIVELLLEKGADVGAEGGEHGNALQAAIHNYRYGVERRLREWVQKAT